ncbi:S-layer homology domain-containing protein [Peptoniphilus duerdenii]|uniref:S-layer homology domain-containing protein n=1 Tax=Peptoniphilus duerdenii TaxID=507750 RepID=UPI00288AF053|nr:S-layer homology domain-containing protein [Peptoniphilus duerdenii]
MKKSKRFLALSLAVAMLPTYSFAKQFSDVAPTGTYKWAYSAIDELSNKNIIAGFNDGTYKPENLVSLPQTLSLLKGIMNPTSEEVTKATNTYGKDLINLGLDTWAIDAAAICLQNNVITMGQLQSAKKYDQIGPGSKSFPAREDIAVFYAKALGLGKNSDTSNLKHKDISDLPIEKKEYLSSLVKAGIFAATGSNGNFNGRNAIRRAEIAIITKAAYDYKSKVQVATAKGNVILASSTNNLNRFIIKDGNSTMGFEYNGSTKFTINGTSADATKLKEGQEVEVKYQKGLGEGVHGIAIEVTIKDVVTQYVGYVSGVYSNQVKVKYTNNNSSIDLKASDSISTSKESTLTLTTNPDITILGIPNPLSNVKEGDMVEFNLDAQGYLTKMVVTPKNGQISGVLKEIGSVDAYKLLKEITVTLKDGKDYKFYVRLDNNLKNTKIDSLKVGNTINEYTNYRFIGNKSNINFGNVAFGTIEKVDYDNNTRRNPIGITIKEYATGNRYDYTINNNTTVNGSYNYNGSFYTGSYVLIENNGSYIKNIQLSNNNSNYGFYRVSAKLNSYNYLKNMFIVSVYDVLQGPVTRNIIGYDFEVKGFNLPNFNQNNNYDFVVQVFSDGSISPILILNQNNSNYGYIR